MSTSQEPSKSQPDILHNLKISAGLAFPRNDFKLLALSRDLPVHVIRLPRDSLDVLILRL